MATPITHLVMANKLYDKYFSSRDKAKFFVATVLPDIRYLVKIDRDITHIKNGSFKEILNKESFDSGWWLHSFVDEQRHKFMVENDYYSYFPESEFVTHAAKLLEDKVLYDQVDNWNEISSFFDSIYNEEIELNLREEDIKKWHKLMKNYIKSEPTDDKIADFIMELGYPKTRVDLTLEVIEKTDVGSATKVIMQFYSNFEKLL